MRPVRIAALLCALATLAHADPVGFAINYIDAVGTGFNAAGAAGAERRAAFEYAVSKYETLLDAQYAGETVRIDARFDNTSFLGYADASWYIYGPLPTPNTYHASALANHLAGIDIQSVFFGDPGGHIDITFANDLIDGAGTEFYLGTDGATPGTQYDFVTVAIHEIMHGLGQVSLVYGDTGRFGLNDPAEPQFPQIYDHYVYDPVTGKTLVQMNDAERLVAITGGNLVWIGPNAVAANGGTPVPLYNPAVFVPGSSISHWDEATYPNELMTPFQNLGQSIHDLSALDRAMLTDIGWNVAAPVPEPSTWMLFAFAGLGVAWARRRRRQGAS